MTNKIYIILAFIAFSFASQAQTDTNMFPLPQDLPKYPGGRKALNEFIHSNLVYPEYEKSKGIEGIVTVTCDVGLDGTLSNFRIQESVDGSVGFDAEAIRICQKLGKFSPCTRNGKPIIYSISIYVTFDLNNGDEMDMAIAKLSKKKLKEIEKDAKWLCDMFSKATEANLSGDENESLRLMDEVGKQDSVFSKKYPSGSPENAQLDKLVKPCFEELIKSTGLPVLDEDMNLVSSDTQTKASAKFSKREIKSLEKDSKRICEYFSKMSEASQTGDKESFDKTFAELKKFAVEIDKRYPVNSPKAKELERLFSPCLEEAKKAIKQP